MLTILMTDLYKNAGAKIVDKNQIFDCNIYVKLILLQMKRFHLIKMEHYLFLYFKQSKKLMC
jgi:alanine dehydrogenase